MARDIVERLAGQLSGLLREIDTAIAARFEQPSRSAGTRHREDSRPVRPGLRGMCAAALRWLRAVSR
jgi:hypothetical protein